MAADGFMALLGSDLSTKCDPARLGAGNSGPRSPTASSRNFGWRRRVVAEGEPADDLVAFAKALTDSGTRYFGAAWCPHCTDQKELFQDGGKFLPFIEVTNPDHTPNQIGIDEGITEYPTWEFPDGSRLTGEQTLQTLSQRSGVAIPQSSTPSMARIGNVNVALVHR